jgi:hypothetical protein
MSDSSIVSLCSISNKFEEDEALRGVQRELQTNLYNYQSHAAYGSTITADVTTDS